MRWNCRCSICSAAWPSRFWAQEALPWAASRSTDQEVAAQRGDELAFVFLPHLGMDIDHALALPRDAGARVTVHRAAASQIIHRDVDRLWHARAGGLEDHPRACS